MYDTFALFITVLKKSQICKVGTGSHNVVVHRTYLPEFCLHWLRVVSLLTTLPAFITTQGKLPSLAKTLYPPPS